MGRTACTKVHFTFSFTFFTEQLRERNNRWKLLIFTNSEPKLRPSIFWDVTQHRLVDVADVSGGLSIPFLKVKQSKKMGQIGWSETTVMNCESTLHNIP